MFNVPIHSVNDGKPTQLIKEDGLVNETSQALKTPLTTGRPGATQRIDSSGATSQTQPIKSIEPQYPNKLRLPAIILML